MNARKDEDLIILSDDDTHTDPFSDVVLTDNSEISSSLDDMITFEDTTDEKENNSEVVLMDETPELDFSEEIKEENNFAGETLELDTEETPELNLVKEAAKLDLTEEVSSDLDM